MEYLNPVYEDYFADPYVLRHGTEYFAFGTGPKEERGTAFTVLRSENLIHWERAGSALIKPDSAFGDDFWAPEVAYEDGRFWMYYSVGRGDKGHQVRVASSFRPEGPYEDIGRLTDPSSTFAIDASPFQDDDGQWYLFYARDFLDTDRPGTALVVDRLVTMDRIEHRPVTVLRAAHEWQRFMKDRLMYGAVYDWHTLEGPCVRKHGDRYFCLYSGGNWQNDTYGVDYAEANAPMGPYVGGTETLPRTLRTVPGKVLGPGHCSITVGPDDETEYIVYHAWDPAMTARRMCIDPLIWTPDGPRCEGPSFEPRQLATSSSR